MKKTDKKRFIIWTMLASLVILASTAFTTSAFAQKFDESSGTSSNGFHIIPKEANYDGSTLKLTVLYVNANDKDVVGLDHVHFVLTDNVGVKEDLTFSDDALKSTVIMAGNTKVDTFLFKNAKAMDLTDLQTDVKFDIKFGTQRFNKGIHIVVNNSVLKLPVSPVLTSKGNTLVPIRAIFEALGADVTWNSKTNTAIAKKGNSTFQVSIGETSFIRDGKRIDLSESCKLVNGTTMIPLRSITEAMDSYVTWFDNNGESSVVSIHSF
jgi:hypothetical protein